MLTNEQKALKQILVYLNQNKVDQLSFYFQLIDPQSFLDKKYTKIFQALKYLTLGKTTNHPFDKIKSQNEIIKELLAYLQTHFPQDHFTKESLSFLSDDVNGRKIPVTTKKN